MSKRPKPRRTCVATERGGERCKEWAVPGKKQCARHAAQRASADPEKRAAQMGNLTRGPRTTRSGPPVPDADVLDARVAELSAGVLVRDDNGDVLPALRRIVKRTAACELALEWYDAKPVLTTREQERRRQLEGDLSRFLADLGMTAKAAVDYRKIEREQKAARAPRAVPSRDVGHVKAVLGVLMSAGALGEAAAQFAQSQSDVPPELLLLTPAERAERAANTEEPAENREKVVPDPIALAVVTDGKFDIDGDAESA